MQTALIFCRSIPSCLPWGALVCTDRLFSEILRQRQMEQGGTKLALTQPSALQLSVRKPLILLNFSCVYQDCKSSHQWGTGDTYNFWVRATAFHNLQNHICSRHNFGLLKLFVYSDSFCLQIHFSCPLYFKTISVSLDFFSV